MALGLAAALLTACGDEASGPVDGGAGGESAGGASDGSAGSAAGGDAADCGCAPFEACCDGQCVDLSSDANNCGECGSSCSLKQAESSCSDSACIIASCEDGFVDCNGRAADGCEAEDAGLPSSPRLLSPAIGENTGSALSDAALTPELRWLPNDGDGTCGAVTYQVQVDDSCDADQACDFASPEVDEAGIDEPRFQPQAPLAVSTTAPVGTRYFWRVRACEAEERCSEWSSVRYLNVGRLRDDLNGDGYSDMLAVSYDGESDLHLHLRPGPLGPRDGELTARPTVNLPNPTSTYSTARFLGDVNGDGFADAARSTDYGAELLLGNPAFESIVAVKLAGGFAGQHQVAALGDWNGDGFADFALSDSLIQETPPSVVRVYAGNGDAKWEAPLDIIAPTGSTAGSFGTAVEGGIDFDGDGYTDLFILDGDEGRLHFVAGGAKPTSKIKASLNAGATCPYYLKPSLARAGDMNGDGYGEIAAHCDKQLSVFAGGRTPDLMPLWSHELSDDAQYIGHNIAGGVDFGSDGFSDLLLHGDDKAGPNLFVLAGSAMLSNDEALLPFAGPLDKEGTAKASEGLSTGDYDGDGRPDLLVQVASVGELRLFSGGKTASGNCPAAPELTKKVGDWCRTQITTIEGKYSSQWSPDYPIGGSFGFALAQ